MRSSQVVGAMCVWVLLVVACVYADPVEQGALTQRERNLARVRAIDGEQMKTYGGKGNFLLSPGLLADKTGRVVRVAAESLRLSAGSPVEFPLITANSGKDYEAHSVSFASAMDIHNALKFIGLTPGHGVDGANLQFWPRGDRVAVTFHYQDPASTNWIHVPAGRLTLDTRTGKSLPENGFVFTGSEWFEATEPTTTKVYSADAFTPNCIVSHYNERTTVLDVPRRDSQNAVYSYQVPNPEFLLPSNQLIEVMFEPYFKDRLPHISDFTLNVVPGTSTGMADLAYSLMDQAGQPVNTNLSFSGFLAALERFSGADQDVYVTFRPDDALPMVDLQKAARLLDTLDTERGIRVEAPPKGHPYFRTFLPNEKHRKREDRPSVASELLLEAGGGGITGTLVLVGMDWKGDDSAPTFSETRIPISRADQLIPAMTSKEDAPAVILIFVPPAMKYGAFREFIAPLLQRKTILYVFVQKPSIDSQSPRL
jgi:hypothetical protein